MMNMRWVLKIFLQFKAKYSLACVINYIAQATNSNFWNNGLILYLIIILEYILSFRRPIRLYVVSQGYLHLTWLFILLNLSSEVVV